MTGSLGYIASECHFEKVITVSKFGLYYIVVVTGRAIQESFTQH